MAANTVTYFGDVLTVGNTLVSQGLTVQGSYMIFSGNLNPATTTTTNVTVPFVFTSNSNTTTANVYSFACDQSIGVNTTGGGATLNIAGNTWTLNALSATNVFATTSANVPTLNTSVIFGAAGFVGIGRTASGAVLNVAANATATDSFGANNVFALTSINVYILNTTSISGTSGSVGIGVIGTGATLNIAGNAWASNALSTPNVFALTSANLESLNTSTIFSSTGFYGIGGAGGGATLNVAGNAWASNALATPNVFALTSANLESLNTSTIFSTTGNVGIGGASGWARLNIAGNAWASNALAAPNVFALTSANLESLNTSTIFSSTGFYGIGGAGGGATLNVAGNAWASNALSTPNIFALTSANLESLNTSIIRSTTGFIGINTAGGGATLNVAGNAWASNALATPNVFALTSANLESLNTSTIRSTTGFIGINTAGGGATLNVAGNAWASNALAAPNVFALTSANLESLNTSTICSTTGFIGINSAGGGATLNVTGNVWTSNALVTANLTLTMNANIVTMNLTSTKTAGVGINMPAQAGTTLVGGPPDFMGGTLSGDAAPVNDAPTSNLALQFSSSSTSYLNMGLTSPAHVNINTTHIFVEAWIYSTTTGQPTINIASYGNGSTSGWYMSVKTGGGAGSGLNVGNSSKSQTGIGNFSLGQWTYVAFRSNPTNGQVYGWIATTGTTTNQSTAGASAPTYSASDPFYIGAINGFGGLSNGVLYIRDLRVISGTSMTNTTNYTPDQAPFGASVPSYVTGTGLAYSWGLQASSNLYQAPQPLVKVADNVFTSNSFDAALGIFSNVYAATSNLGPTATKCIFSPSAGGIIGIGQTPVVGGATLQVTGNVYASNALAAPNIFATTSANSLVVSNISSMITGPSLKTGIDTSSPAANLHVAGNVYVANTISAIGLNQQLPVTGFTGTGVAGAYTNVANGVTFTIGASSETSTHEAWRAATTPVTFSSGVSVPAVGRFQLFERDAMSVGNTLWSPNGRYYFTVNATTQTIQDYFLSTTVATVSTSTITSLYLTTAGFLQGVNSAGTVVYTSANSATGYGPYRFAIENQGFAAIYDRYNTVLYQLGSTQSGWQTSGTYGGDTVTTSGGYRIHTFTTVGSQRFVIPNYLSSLSVDYLIVAGGGGGGGGWQGGGGGAGGLLAASTALSNGVYTVTVGAGGVGLTSTTAPTNGGNSSLVNTIGGTALATPTAFGGGAGGFEGNLLPLAAIGAGQNGGSGGGGAWSTLTAGTGTVGQGNNGGTAFNGANYTGAGGGGAGGVGQDSTSTTGGNGGIGVASSITTASIYYAGGGGGSARGSAVTTTGGAGGGGNGYGAGNGSSATYYGGGGGAGGSAGAGTEPCDGGNGYQGIVIIRYLISSVAVSNAWGFSTVPQTLTFSTPLLYLPRSLIIQGTDYNNSANSANAFTFKGSMDGVTYTTLISSSTFLSNTDYGYNAYAITSNTAWKYLQLQVTGADSTPGYVNQMILTGHLSWSPTSNSITMNASTTNVLQIIGTSGTVGFGTSVAGGPTAYIGGNIYASNTLSGQNVIVTTIQSYNEDITRRAPHLTPNSANYLSIQNWITASCNTTQKVGWSVPSTNVTFNTSTVGVTGSALYSTSVLGPDGRVYFSPSSAGNIGVFNPRTNEFSTIVPLGGASLSGTNKYGPGILCPNGNIFFISYGSTTSLIFNPIDKTATNSSLSLTAFYLGAGVLGGTGEIICPPNVTNTTLYRLNPNTGASNGTLALGSGYGGAVLTPTGNIVCIPMSATTIRVVNSTATSCVRSTVHSQTTPAYVGGVLVPDGNVVCVPYSSVNVTLYNPVLGTMTHVPHGCGSVAFSGGVLLPTGNVIFVPQNSSNVGMFDPVAQTYSNLVSVGATAGKYSGGTLLPDGRVIMAQYNASNVGILNTRTPASLEFCRSPYFNKF